MQQKLDSGTLQEQVGQDAGGYADGVLRIQL